jgi:hypothetical protein
MKAKYAPAALLLATAGCADSDETSEPAGAAAITVAAGFEAHGQQNRRGGGALVHPPLPLPAF